MNPRDERMGGFTLIEVLITLVVFSIGLLSVAGLQAISKKANYDALQRTTATMLAHDIVERMRANATQLDEYMRPAGSELGGATLTAPTPDCVTNPCNATQLAFRDLYDWERALDGASELVSGALSGGLVDPTACIEGEFGGAAGIYTIAIAWRGVTELSNPVIHPCGVGTTKYGDANEYRRILVITTYITPTT